MLNILLSNSKDRKWVERELEEFSDSKGYCNLKDVLMYWLNFFKKSKYPVKKFIEFKNNFLNTYKNEIK